MHRLDPLEKGYITFVEFKIAAKEMLSGDGGVDDEEETAPDATAFAGSGRRSSQGAPLSLKLRSVRSALDLLTKDSPTGNRSRRRAASVAVRRSPSPLSPTSPETTGGGADDTASGRASGGVGGSGGASYSMDNDKHDDAKGNNDDDDDDDDSFDDDDVSSLRGMSVGMSGVGMSDYLPPSHDASRRSTAVMSSDISAQLDARNHDVLEERDALRDTVESLESKIDALELDKRRLQEVVDRKQDELVATNMEWEQRITTMQEQLAASEDKFAQMTKGLQMKRELMSRIQRASSAALHSAHGSGESKQSSSSLSSPKSSSSLVGSASSGSRMKKHSSMYTRTKDRRPTSLSVLSEEGEGDDDRGRSSSFASSSLSEPNTGQSGGIDSPDWRKTLVAKGGSRTRRGSVHSSAFKTLVSKLDIALAPSTRMDRNHLKDMNILQYVVTGVGGWAFRQCRPVSFCAAVCLHVLALVPTLPFCTVNPHA